MVDALPICVLNNRLIPIDQACVSPLDRGFLFGDGIYEVIPCFDGHAFRLEAHLDRLDQSLAALGITAPHSRAEWSRWVDELTAANGGGDLGCYIQITRGTAPGRDFLPDSELRPTVFGFCWRLAPPSRTILESGISAVTLKDIRWLRCDIKSVSLAGPVLLRREADAHQADEAILIRDGYLAEGSSSAVFMVNETGVTTAPAGPKRLPSITRQVVAEALNSLGFALNEREIPAAELALAREIWIASATREVLPVTQLDASPIGTGKPGSLWQRVYAAFQAIKDRECRP